MRTPQRLRQALAAGAAMTVIFGAQALASDNDPGNSEPLTVTLVSTGSVGSRTLNVTGVNGSDQAELGTTPMLAFDDTSTQAPFGVIVTDVLHDEQPYVVDATLSNLYRFSSGAYVCGDEISSSAFTVTYPFSTSLVTSITEAVVLPTFTFEDTDLTDQIVGVIGLPAEIESTVDGLVDTLATSLDLMAVNNGPDGAGFAGPADHAATGGCGGGATSPSQVILQDGDPSTTDHAQLVDDMLATVVAGGVTPAELDALGLLDIDALVADVESQLSGIVGLTLPLLTTLTDVAEDIVADMTLVASSLDVLQQSGVYANVPALNYDSAVSSASAAGTYRGTMTVTLTDQ